MCHPTNETPEESNASEQPLTASQHRIMLADKLMDWMGANQISYERASDICGVPTSLIVAVCNRTPINPKMLLKISAKVPGLSEHILGEQ